MRVSTAGSGVLDSWELTGVHSPHDIALSAAPVGATAGGSRSLAVYVAETARGRASRLHKFIIHHPGASPDVVVCFGGPGTASDGVHAWQHGTTTQHGRTFQLRVLISCRPRASDACDNARRFPS